MVWSPEDVEPCGLVCQKPGFVNEIYEILSKASFSELDFFGFWWKTWWKLEAIDESSLRDPKSMVSQWLRWNVGREPCDRPFVNFLLGLRKHRIQDMRASFANASSLCNFILVTSECHILAWFCCFDKLWQTLTVQVQLQDTQRSASKLFSPHVFTSDIWLKSSVARRSTRGLPSLWPAATLSRSKGDGFPWFSAIFVLSVLHVGNTRWKV